MGAVGRDTIAARATIAPVTTRTKKAAAIAMPQKYGLLTSASRNGRHDAGRERAIFVANPGAVGSGCVGGNGPVGAAAPAAAGAGGSGGTTSAGGAPIPSAGGGRFV